MKQIAFIALITLLGLASTSYARDGGFEIPKTVDLPMPSFEDRSIDIVGVKPGQSEQEAVEILKARFPKERIDYRYSDVGTDQVHSQNFNTAYSVGGDLSEQMKLFLASPSAGSQVIGAMREKYFRKSEGQPKMDALYAELVKKYGQPDRDVVQGNNPRRTISWYVGGNGKCEKLWLCQWPYYDHNYSKKSAEYNPNYLQEYVKQMGVGADYVVTAVLNPEDREMVYVSTMTVSFVDLKRRGLSAKADFDLVMAKQDEFEQKPVAMPEL